MYAPPAGRLKRGNQSCNGTRLVGTTWRLQRPAWTRREEIEAQRARFLRHWHSSRMMGRLLVVNAMIRVAAAASGQLLAFLLADRHARHVGIGSILVGALGTLFFITELVGSPIAGRLSDRYGPAKILRLGPILGAASGLLAAVTVIFGNASVAALVILLIGRLAEGSSAACIVPPTLVVVARATPGDPVRRTRAMGFFEIGSLCGIIAGYALAGFAWDLMGPRSFVLLAAAYAAALPIIPKASGQLGASPRSEGVIQIIKRLAQRPGTVPFAIAWLAVNAILALWVQYIPYLLRLPLRPQAQHLVGGYSGTEIGVVFSVWGLTFLIGLGLWSWLGGAIRRRQALAISLLGALGLTVCLAAANHGGGALPLAAALVFVMIEAGFTPSAFAHLADITEGVDASRGAALGLYSLLLGVGQLLGGLLGAPMVSAWQMDGLLALTILLGLVALGGVAWMEPGPVTQVARA